MILILPDIDGNDFVCDVDLQGSITVDDQQMSGLWVVLFTVWFLAGTRSWVMVHFHPFMMR